MSESEALNQPGELFRHKHGGIYRLVEITSIRNSDFKWTGNQPVRLWERKRRPAKPIALATYEHLWPHEWARYQRPHEEFSEEGRFVKVVRLQG